MNAYEGGQIAIAATTTGAGGGGGDPTIPPKHHTLDVRPGLVNRCSFKKTNKLFAIKETKMVNKYFQRGYPNG